MPSKITMFKLSCTVASGETSANDTSRIIRGRILSIKTELNNTTPASSSDRDIDIYEMNPYDSDDTSDAIQHVLDIGDVGATPASDNAVYYPRTRVQTYQGSDWESTSNYYIPTYFDVFGRLYLNVTNAAEGDTTNVYVLVEEY